MSKDRQDLARYLLQHSADDAPPQLTAEAQAWAEGEVLRIERERIERLEKALRQIMLVKPIHCVTGDERHGVNFGDVGRGIATCQEIAAKGLER